MAKQVGEKWESREIYCSTFPHCVSFPGKLVPKRENFAGTYDCMSEGAWEWDSLLLLQTSRFLFIPSSTSFVLPFPRGCFFVSYNCMSEGARGRQSG